MFGFVFVLSEPCIQRRMCIYWSDTLKQVGIFYGSLTWTVFEKYCLTKPILPLFGINTTTVHLCKGQDSQIPAVSEVIKTTPSFHGLLGEFLGFSNHSYLGLGFTTAKEYKAESGKRRAHGAKSGESQTPVSKNSFFHAVRKYELDFSSNQLW